MKKKKDKEGRRGNADPQGRGKEKEEGGRKNNLSRTASKRGSR